MGAMRGQRPQQLLQLSKAITQGSRAARAESHRAWGGQEPAGSCRWGGATRRALQRCCCRRRTADVMLKRLSKWGEQTLLQQ